MNGVRQVHRIIYPQFLSIFNKLHIPDGIPSAGFLNENRITSSLLEPGGERPGLRQ